MAQGRVSSTMIGWKNATSCPKRNALQNTLGAIHMVGVPRITKGKFDMDLSIFKFLCCISKSMINHQHKSDTKVNLPIFTYGYWKCVLVDSLIEYVAPSDCVHCVRY